MRENCYIGLTRRALDAKDLVNVIRHVINGRLSIGDQIRPNTAEVRECCEVVKEPRTSDPHLLTANTSRSMKETKGGKKEDMPKDL